MNNRPANVDNGPVAEMFTALHAKVRASLDNSSHSLSVRIVGEATSGLGDLWRSFAFLLVYGAIMHTTATHSTIKRFSATMLYSFLE